MTEPSAQSQSSLLNAFSCVFQDEFISIDVMLQAADKDCVLTHTTDDPNRRTERVL